MRRRKWLYVVAASLTMIAIFGLVILLSPRSDSQYDPPWLAHIKPNKIETEVREDRFIGKDRFVMEKYWLVDEPLKAVTDRLASTYRGKYGFEVRYQGSKGDLYVGTPRRLTYDPGYSVNTYRIGNQVRIQVSMVREANWFDKMQHKLRKYFRRK